MTRTEESLGGAVNFARISSADARFPRAKTAFMISRSRRVRRSVGGFGICDSCRILDATDVACQPGRVCGTKKEPPGTNPGALAYAEGSSLPADLEAGSTTRAAAAGVTGGDKLDPERILALVVRGVAGLTQRIQAVLRRTRGRGGESRQLEDHPRAAIQLRHGEVH